MDRHTVQWTIRQFDRQTYSPIVRNTNKWTERQSVGQTHCQMGMPKA